MSTNVEILENENAQMRNILETIMANDVLPHWAYEPDETGQSLAQQIQSFLPEK